MAKGLLLPVLLHFCTASLWHLAYSQVNVTGPTAAPYYSRPDINSIVLNITLKQESLISPGYIFLAPYQNAQAGPYIFDNGGNLVWSGFGDVGPVNTYNFQVCPFKGSDHLCAMNGNQGAGYSRGHDVIMDNTYSVIESIQSGNGLPPLDQHELNMLNGGASIIVTVFHPLQYDLTDFGISGGQGWLMEGVFQEIDTATKKVLFQWNSLDHIGPSASYVLPNTTEVSGDGLTKDTPWDYFHINAVDKNADGDYLVSGRHTETVYKVSGVNGSLIWQLGGKNSDFTQSNYNFSYQHSTRFHSVNSSTTVISMFDNASNGHNTSSQFSLGKVIALNNETMVSSMVQAYAAPDSSGGLSSASQGNLQFLPNGNAFIGWGSNCYISEYTADGIPIFYAWFATIGYLQYRSFKFAWKAAPTTSPALYTYSHNNSAPTTYYVSWNGATEVASWTLYGGSSPEDLTKLGNAQKNGFETVVTQPTFYPYTLAEAVDVNGSGIRNSSVTNTFVPGSVLASSCSEIQCPLIGSYPLSTSSLSSTDEATVPLESPPAISTTSSSSVADGRNKLNQIGLIFGVGFAISLQ